MCQLQTVLGLGRGRRLEAGRQVLFDCLHTYLCVTLLSVWFLGTVEGIQLDSGKHQNASMIRK